MAHTQFCRRHFKAGILGRRRAKGLTHQYDLGVESEVVAALVMYLSGSGFFCYWFGSCTKNRKEERPKSGCAWIKNANQEAVVRRLRRPQMENLAN